MPGPPDAAADVLGTKQALVEQVGRARRDTTSPSCWSRWCIPSGAPVGDTYHEDPGKRPEMVLATVERVPPGALRHRHLQAGDPPDRPDDPGPGVGSRKPGRRRSGSNRIDALLDRPWVMLSAGAGPSRSAAS